MGWGSIIAFAIGIFKALAGILTKMPIEERTDYNDIPEAKNTDDNGPFTDSDW